MNEVVRKVADAVLYEGHMLYPYRPSSVKNRQPFTFGTLEPGESMQAECLVEGDGNTGVEVTVRCIEGVGQAFSLPVRKVFSFPPAQGTLEAKTTEIAPGLLKLTVRVENTTRTNHNLTSTQAILTVQNGAFLSLTDPPDEYREASAQCHNVGVWPILVGEPTRTTVCWHRASFCRITRKSRRKAPAICSIAARSTKF